MIMTQWLEWAKELQALAQTGLFYTRDVYDQERFERIRQIAVEMMSELAELSLPEVIERFSNEVGYQTPKIDTRGVVWHHNKVLLVQERDGLWSLPGGWMDITETIRSNTLKELYEEAGVTATAERIIMVQDRNRHNAGTSLFTIVKFFVECEYHSHSFAANSETLAVDFFSLDDLPPLCEEKTTAKQLALCWQARQAGEDWQVLFD
ncbi:NUDIX hydrolase N-terminal domain-containing protein [Aerococcaceae bacterium NML210727]|nr:NUDIX hydrolase N-terminal domain-containing protein [Aerococcaceae bacterium NML210727]MCW6654355.1 NUDIX hydrolase N-terminal domain-containing protein [Aerococcaceae bacterium NML201296]